MLILFCKLHFKWLVWCALCEKRSAGLVSRWLGPGWEPLYVANRKGATAIGGHQLSMRMGRSPGFLFLNTLCPRSKQNQLPLPVWETIDVANNPPLPLFHIFSPSFFSLSVPSIHLPCSLYFSRLLSILLIFSLLPLQAYPTTHS